MTYKCGVPYKVDMTKIIYSQIKKDIKKYSNKGIITLTCIIETESSGRWSFIRDNGAKDFWFISLNALSPTILPIKDKLNEV